MLTGPAVGAAAQLAMLIVLSATVGLGIAGWTAGVVYALAGSALLAFAMRRSDTVVLGPADWITLTRAVLVGGVTALVADSLTRPSSLGVMLGLGAVALALDGVDGWWARRTNTCSAFGARFDMEVDAFLILVLSVYVSRTAGDWVLAIGLARYALGFATTVLPWLRRPVPPRRWRKVVAAIQGITLAVVAADPLPAALATAALLVALALLTESFGRDVVWLWRRRTEPLPAHRSLAPTSSSVDPADFAAIGRGWLLTASAGVLLWFALAGPDAGHRMTASAFLRVPVEAIVLVALVLLLPWRAGRIVAALAGLVLGALTVVRVADMGFESALHRPFDPLSDLAYLDSAVGVLRDSIGTVGAAVAVVVSATFVAGVLVAAPLAAVRVGIRLRERRGLTLRVAAIGAVVWVGCAAFGIRNAADTPVASTSAAGLAYSEVSLIQDGFADVARFDAEIADDPLAATIGPDLLNGLKGKDVVIVFVESYGRYAVEDPRFSPQVTAVLDAGTGQLARAGFAAQSAFLRSPVFGGVSWLAHATLQSGLWVNSQPRYDKLMLSTRFTLSQAFGRAGWRTVVDVPSNTGDWPQASSFYGYDKAYSSIDVGYQGPRYSYATMPDQYVLSAFQRLELAPTDRSPVMAEIDLVSSHTPWTPRPGMVDWPLVGDGSIFHTVPSRGDSPEAVWADPDAVQAAYVDSIAYTLAALTSWVRAYGSDDLVLVVLGDHQAALPVDDSASTHDVPVSIVAKDPAVFDQIESWGWQPGLRPGPDAPVASMDTFRDRFITAFTG